MINQYFHFEPGDLVPGGRFKLGDTVEIGSYVTPNETFKAKVIRLESHVGGHHPDDIKYHWYTVVPLEDKRGVTTYVHDRTIIRVITLLDELAEI